MDVIQEVRLFIQEGIVNIEAKRLQAEALGAASVPEGVIPVKEGLPAAGTVELRRCSSKEVCSSGGGRSTSVRIKRRGSVYFHNSYASWACIRLGCCCVFFLSTEARRVSTKATNFFRCSSSCSTCDLPSSLIKQEKELTSKI